MTNIRTANDHGDVWYNASAGKCYHKLTGQPTAGLPDTTLAAGDETDIQSISFSHDNTSPYLASWTACERGTADNVAAYNSETVMVQDEYADVYTAPSAGEIRIWHDGSDSRGIYLNGVYAEKNLAYNDHKSFFAARALRLQTGDVVSIGHHNGSGDGIPSSGDTIHVRFRPDSY